MKDFLRGKKTLIFIAIIELVVIIVLAIMLKNSANNHKTQDLENENIVVENTENLVEENTEISEESLVDVNINENDIEKYREFDEQILDKAHELIIIDRMLEEDLKEENKEINEEEKNMQKEMIKDRLNKRQNKRKELKDLLDKTSE